MTVENPTIARYRRTADQYFTDKSIVRANIMIIRHGDINSTGPMSSGPTEELLDQASDHADTRQGMAELIKEHAVQYSGNK